MIPDGACRVCGSEDDVRCVPSTAWPVDPVEYSGLLCRTCRKERGRLAMAAATERLRRETRR